MSGYWKCFYQQDFVIGKEITTFSFFRPKRFHRVSLLRCYKKEKKEK